MQIASLPTSHIKYVTPGENFSTHLGTYMIKRPQDYFPTRLQLLKAGVIVTNVLEDQKQNCMFDKPDR